MLPPDLLGRVIAGHKDLAGLTPSDYHLAPGETPREAANRAWSYLTGVWANFRATTADLAESDPAVGLTRDRWLLLLLRELGYGRVPTTPAGGLVVDDRAFPCSHLWEQAPIHLLGWNVRLDTRTRGVPGAAERAPHPMLQELLNRADEYLWGLLSNGKLLRILRDSTSLAGQSYVEFDLEAMFDGEVFSDFVLLYLMAHQSRVEVLTPGGPATDCWLERWRTASIESGTRALGLLRDGVAEAISALGNGFLDHPGNADLRTALESHALDVKDYRNSLLRLVYRLLFLFVAEDRGALLIGSDAQARERYATYFSTARLRRLALRRRGTKHTDLWAGLSVVIGALGRDDGCRELALPGLGGLFDDGPSDVLTGYKLPNDALLAAARHLSVVQPKGQPKRTVDYRNLGAEELGSIYESLLELVPFHNSAERTFTLETLAGNDRKTSGSYYTPTSLIDLVLDEALDPLLDDAEKTSAADGGPEAALLSLTVCDPACGSGHFLVAAARRIAARLARVRTQDLDPSPTDLQTAMHDVVSRCIYGVDLNPMAAELARVSLWLEALQPGRPLTFLDSHIKIGNALLGTTPALLAAGIPDAAYAPIEGDDKKWAAALRKRNRAEADTYAASQGDLFADAGLPISNTGLREKLAGIESARMLTLTDAHIARARYADYQNSPGLDRARRLADTWSAAFVQQKVEGAPSITDRTLRAVADGEAPLKVQAEVEALAARYRFFHWHLEFPQIFRTDGVAASLGGWSGGFSAVVGNPPWERVKIEEQEFFSSRDAGIANTTNASARKKLIADLPRTDPDLWGTWAAAKREAEGESHLLRAAGRYPLCGVGDVNTYSVFAEHMREATAKNGRTGLISPAGLATDATTAAFFADNIREQRLVSVYGFATGPKIWNGLGHNKFRFIVTTITGGERASAVNLAFDRAHPEELRLAGAVFSVASGDLGLVNPNTGTLPTFANPTDARITLGVYGRQPVLIRDGAVKGNPWQLRFATFFHLTNHSGLFNTASELSAAGARFNGWSWESAAERWLPLYEAKLINYFDHRFSTYADLPPGFEGSSLPRLSDQSHDDPTVEPLSRAWITEDEVERIIGARWARGWLLGWRDITYTTNERSFMPCVLPRSAVGNSVLIGLPEKPSHAPLLQAVWSSLPFDYVSRQKLSGTHMNQFIVKQLACPPPSTFDGLAPWQSEVNLAAWVRPRVLELTYTSYRIAPYARDIVTTMAGLPLDDSAAPDAGPPFRWLPERRELIRAELDAAMFHIYGLSRGETEHVLDSFPVVRKYEERDHGEFRTKRLVLDRYDAMSDAIETGNPYGTPLGPPPGFGPRHPA
jgi:hypothetical protein